ncbi:MAG: hypothetical protein SFT68_03470 [Rickettsiaceae bacterium]|nr:hypothetical protein [Rickettsiaceae bacterium]
MQCLRFAVICFLSSMILSCGVFYPQDLKKSANDKYFDARGFDRAKRKPLYNKKYISKAKTNIINNNYDYDDDVDEENLPPSYKNIQRYRQMVRARHAREYRQRAPEYLDDEYYYAEPVDVPTARKRFSEVSKSEEDKQNLESEIKEIKSLLEETRDHFAKTKCYKAKQSDNNTLSQDDVTDFKNALSESSDKTSSSKPYKPKTNKAVKSSSKNSTTSNASNKTKSSQEISKASISSKDLSLEHIDSD